MAKRVMRFVADGGLVRWLTKHVVLRPVWLWYCFRARSFWFFTPSNPTITFGGFAGVSRMQIFKQLPLGTFPATALVTTAMSAEHVEELARRNGITFPFLVMPDVAAGRWMLRQIETAEQLHQYHRAMSVPYVLQALDSFPLAVSIFYHRLPGVASGHISAVQRHEHGQVVNMDPESYSALCGVFDNISRRSNSFYYGCYRIRCHSAETLKEGRKFTILEYCGASADTHEPAKSFIQTWRATLERWRTLYRISTENRKRGIPCWHHSSGSDFVSHIRDHDRRLRRLDHRFEFADAVETVFIPPSLMPFAQEYARSLLPRGKST